MTRSDELRAIISDAQKALSVYCVFGQHDMCKNSKCECSCHGNRLRKEENETNLINNGERKGTLPGLQRNPGSHPRPGSLALRRR